MARCNQPFGVNRDPGHFSDIPRPD